MHMLFVKPREFLNMEVSRSGFSSCQAQHPHRFWVICRLQPLWPSVGNCLLLLPQMQNLWNSIPTQRPGFLESWYNFSISYQVTCIPLELGWEGRETESGWALGRLNWGSPAWSQSLLLAVLSLWPWTCPLIYLSFCFFVFMCHGNTCISLYDYWSEIKTRDIMGIRTLCIFPTNPLCLPVTSSSLCLSGLAWHGLSDLRLCSPWTRTLPVEFWLHAHPCSTPELVGIATTMKMFSMGLSRHRSASSPYPKVIFLDKVRSRKYQISAIYPNPSEAWQNK